MFIPQKDSVQRFCVDHRKLNKATWLDSYPISRTDKCIDSLSHATVFSPFDANSGYGQIKNKNSDKNKTASTLHHGLYCSIEMFFNLCNAPETIQQTLDILHYSVKWQFAFVYTDNIVIFRRTLKQPVEHVRKVYLFFTGRAEPSNQKRVATSPTPSITWATLYIPDS